MLAGARIAVTLLGPAQAQGARPLTTDPSIADHQAGQALVGASFAVMKNAVDTKSTDPKLYKGVAAAIAR